MTSSRRGIAYVSAALAAAAIISLWLGAGAPKAAPAVSTPEAVLIADVSAVSPEAGDAEWLSLAQRDPLEFVRRAHERFQRDVRTYQATFTKQERLKGALGAVQEIDFRYRAEPTTIYMQWQKNADACKRALFINLPEYINEDGQKMVRVEPNGLARLIVADIMMPSDGPEAKKASRHSIEYAGFDAYFRMFTRYGELARSNGDLDLSCVGLGQVDGRDTIVLARQLPYTGPKGAYPDARLVTHFDRELLVPVAIYSYADRDEQQLLGKYIYTNVELNPPFGDDAFEF